MWNLLVIQPLAFAINAVYDVVQNYGLAIVLFTVLVRALLWPLTMKGQKSNMAMQKLQPQLREIQEKYKGDRMKVSQKMGELYQKENVKPMSGCLPQLIPAIFMIAMFWIVAQPLRHLLGMDIEQVQVLYDALVERGAELQAFAFYRIREVELLSMAVDYGITGVRALNFNFLGLNMAVTPGTAIMQNFFTPYWIFPIVTGLGTWYSSKLMYIGIDAAKAAEETAEAARKAAKKAKKAEQAAKRANAEKGTDAAESAEVAEGAIVAAEGDADKEKKKDEEETVKPPDMATQMRSLSKIMPFFSAFISFQFSAALGVYQVTNSIVQIIQQLYINKKVIKVRSATP